MNTKQIEALKLALEALEWNLPVIEDWGGEGALNLQHKAITAIREALAEQPAQQQEPVAWMHPDGRIWTFGRGFDKSTFTIPLYTTPPHRKPLTDEEIEAIHQSTWMQSTATLNDFARAIEAAHGIGEKPDAA